MGEPHFGSVLWIHRFVMTYPFASVSGHKWFRYMDLDVFPIWRHRLNINDQLPIYRLTEE